MRSILSQSAWLFFAQVIARGIGFFYTLFLAGNLGVESFGLFSVALAYFSLFSTLSEFGFNRFLVRELSISPKNITELLYNIGFLRLILTAIFYILFVVPLWIFDPDQFRSGLVTLAVIAVFPLAIAETIDGVFVAQRKLQFSSIAMVITSVITSISGILFTLKSFGPAGPVFALIIGQAVYLATLFLLLKNQGLKLFAKANMAAFKKIIFGSLPYGILGILGLLYFKIDTIILSYLKGNFDTGIYTAGYKFLEAANIIPIAISLGIFPVMARLQNNRIQSLKKLYIKVSWLMFLLGVVVTLCFVSILPLIIQTILPSYQYTVDVIKILALAIPFMFVHATAAQVVLSSEKYLKPLILLSIFPLALNIVLNLIFIPTFGFLAASWITVISDIFSMSILLIFLHKYFFKDG